MFKDFFFLHFHGFSIDSKSYKEIFSRITQHEPEEVKCKENEKRKHLILCIYTLHMHWYKYTLTIYDHDSYDGDSNVCLYFTAKGKCCKLFFNWLFSNIVVFFVLFYIFCLISFVWLWIYFILLNIA